MPSFGSTETREAGYMPTVKYHRAGSLLPMANQAHKFIQIYFINDDNLEAEQRRNNIPGTDFPLVMQLQQMLHTHNHYAKDFKTALERMPNDEHILVIHANNTPVGQYERRTMLQKYLNK